MFNTKAINLFGTIISNLTNPVKHSIPNTSNKIGRCVYMRCGTKVNFDQAAIDECRRRSVLVKVVTVEVKR